jgi:hypothetical protein
MQLTVNIPEPIIAKLRAEGYTEVQIKAIYRECIADLLGQNDASLNLVVFELWLERAADDIDDIIQ